MKKIRMILMAASAAAVFIMPSFSVSAEDMTKLTDNEKEQMINAINADKAASAAASGYDIRNAYKSYCLRPFMLSHYKDNHDFKALIAPESENARIHMPVFKDTGFKDILSDTEPAEGIDLCFWETNGRLEIIGNFRCGVPCVTVWDFNTIRKQITEIIENTYGQKVKNIIHTTTIDYCMDIIYIETEEAEYAVPYFLESNWNRAVKLGQIYELSDFMDRLEKCVNSLDSSYLPDDEAEECTAGTQCITEAVTVIQNEDNFKSSADINNDGIFSIADIVKLQQYLSGKTAIDEKKMICADMNCDGNVDVFDLIYMKRKLIGKISDSSGKTDHESYLREKYPEYFDLYGSKGLELYVFQTVPGDYRCVLTEGTNRDKTDEEIEKLFSNSAGIDDMKVILSYYDIPEKDIFIIPWQSLVWEYAYQTDDAYCEKIREMLFGKS